MLDSVAKIVWTHVLTKEYYYNVEERAGLFLSSVISLETDPPHVVAGHVMKQMCDGEASFSLARVKLNWCCMVGLHVYQQ